MFAVGAGTEYSIVSCGTLRPELCSLREQGFLTLRHLLFTAPGLHENPSELENQLHRQVKKAINLSDNAIVVYGSRCFVDSTDPERDIDALLDEHGPRVRRIRAENCVGMLASTEKRQSIAGPNDIYWLTPGWVRHWRDIFREWDRGKANETFPRHNAAIVLDGVDFFEEYAQNNPDEVLAFSDWMGIPLEPQPVSLNRLRQLINDQLEPEE